MTRSKTHSRTTPVLLVLAGILTLAVKQAGASDWPQFRGPNRDGVSTETGLLKSWPTGGPGLMWKCPLRGEGHAAISVAGGRVYGMGLRGEDEVVWAVDEKTGKEVWSRKIAGQTRLGGGQGGYGPRCTPTAAGDNLYVEGVG